MIAYNTKDWFTFIFRFHKSDTVRRLFPMMIAIGAYSWLLAYVALTFLQPIQRDYLKNLNLLHSLLGFVISLLLVFRTNTAYDRWWEGRRLWSALGNSSRNLSIKINAMLEPNRVADRAYFLRAIPLYAQLLKAHLQLEKTRLALDEHEHPEQVHTGDDRHQPNQLARSMTARVTELHRQGVLNGYEMLSLQTELQSFTDICGACERIKNTPIPFSYALFIKKFIFFYVMTLPMGFVFSMGYYVIPVVMFIFYVLVSIELLAEEIEDPFGGDSNDLPLDKMAEKIDKHVREIFEQS